MEAFHPNYESVEVGFNMEGKVILPSLAGKVAVVTGAASGIGQATAELLATNGTKLFLIDSNQEALEALLARLDDACIQCIGQLADVTNEGEIKQAFFKCLNTYGKIDILCNVAGGSLGLSQNTAELNLTDWNKVIALNLNNVFVCCREVITPMSNQGYGRIVNVSSLAGQVASEVTNAAYASAKAGVIQFTRHLALELGAKGIAVNAVSPGYTASSPRVKKLWASQNMDAIFQRVALHREATAMEQANAIVFLASDEASYITGTILDVNGGAIIG